MTTERLPRSTRAKLNRPDPGAAQRQAMRLEMARIAARTGLPPLDDDAGVGGALELRR